MDDAVAVEAEGSETDLLVAANVPPEVQTAVNAMVLDQRKGFIVSHPQAREVAAIVGMHRLDSRSGLTKLTWDELALGLNKDYPGLDATGTKLRAFCSRVLDPMLVVPSGWARRALLDASGELNTAKTLLDLREEALAAIDKMRSQVGEFDLVDGKGGKVTRVPTGPSLGEFTKALKDAAEITEKFAKEAARYGLLPESKTDKGMEVNVNLNLMGGGRMSRALGSPPIDVTPRHDDGPRSS